MFDPLQLRDLFHVQPPLVTEAEGFGFFSEDDVDMLKKITTGSITFGLVLKNSSQYLTNRKSKINFNFRSKHNLSFRYLDITAPLLLYLRFVQLFSLSLFWPM